MSIEIKSYNHAKEIPDIIKNINHENIRYIIPSKKDKLFMPSNLPNLWTWNEIYSDITRNDGINIKHTFSPPDHRLILRFILDNVKAQYKEKINDFPGIDRTGFLDVISSDIRELMNESVSPDKLIHNIESDNPSEFLLPEVYMNYINYLEKYNLLDSAGICTASINAMNKNLDWGKNLVIVFVGFLSFTHSQLELVNALEARCRHIIVIKPEANLANFHDASMQLHKSSHAKKSSGKIIELKITEPELEPELIARTLALWHEQKLESLGKFPGFDAIGIMINQDKQDSYSQALTRYGIPYDFMSGIPINQTLPGKILVSINHLNTRNFPAYETALLLSQPCFAGINFPIMSAYTAGRTGLDKWEEYLSGSQDQVFVDALNSIKAIKKLTESLARKNTPLKIMKIFLEFLETPGLWLNREDKISEFPELDETIRQTASAIDTIKHKVLTLSELLPDIGQVQDERLIPENAYEFLEDWCKNTNTRAPIQNANSIRIFTNRPPVLASFPIWIMTEVNQRNYSGNINKSPLLGDDERKKLIENEAFLPLRIDKANQREAVFRRLIHTGEELTIISRAMLDNEGRPVAESPFMQKFRDDMKNWNIFQSEIMGMNILLGGDNYLFANIDPIESIIREQPKIIKTSHNVGASDIHELLLCPFLWHQKRIANIYEQDSELANNIDWGNLLHKFWECVWREYRVNMNDSGRKFTEIANSEWKKLMALDTESDYDKFRRLIKDPRLKRKLDTIKFRVDRLITIQSEILDGLHEMGCVHKEIRLENDKYLQKNIDGVNFTGQCDRIEIIEYNGITTAFIVDYKTGRGSNYESSTKIKDYSWNIEGIERFNKGIQLSVYSALFNEYTLSGLYILSLEDGQVFGTIKQNFDGIFKNYENDKLKIDGDIMARELEGEYAMRCAVEILRKNEFMPEYDCDLCKYCKIKSLCRKGEFKSKNIIDES